MNPKISLFLRRIGLRATLTGFHYLAYALSLVLQDETYLLHLTTRLYPQIAERFSVSVFNVERCLRTAVNVFWDRGNIRILEDLLGYPIPDKPYAGEFIDMLAGYLRSSGNSSGV